MSDPKELPVDDAEIAEIEDSASKRLPTIEKIVAAITSNKRAGADGWRNVTDLLYMSIPANEDKDADLVLTWAVQAIQTLLKAYRQAVARAEAAEAERDDIQKMLAKHALLPVEDSDIQRLGARLADLLLADDFNSIEPTLNGLIEERDQLRADNERLREALERHGTHDSLCAVIGGYGYCSCGLDAALKRMEQDDG
jgi:hypothetical protein